MLEPPYIVDFLIYPCLWLFSSDFSTPLQVSLSRGYFLGVVIMNILICLTPAIESNCWEKQTEDMDKSENKQYNVTVHESFNQFICWNHFTNMIQLEFYVIYLFLRTTLSEA